MVIYEGMGPAGVSVMVQCVTDNKSRTAPHLRHIFKEHGGSLGTTGSVAFKFNKVGQMDVSGISPESADTFVDAAISLGPPSLPPSLPSRETLLSPCSNLR